MIEPIAWAAEVIDDDGRIVTVLLGSRAQADAARERFELRAEIIGLRARNASLAAALKDYSRTALEAAAKVGGEMSNIVEQLRSYAHPNSWTESISSMLIEAADEIERLRARETEQAERIAELILVGPGK